MNTELHKTIEVLSFIWQKLTLDQFSLGKVEKAHLTKCLKEFSPKQIYEGMKITISTMKVDTDGKYNQEELYKAFLMIGGICYNRSRNPLDSKKIHLTNLIKKIYGNKETILINEVVNNLFEALLFISSQDLQMEIVDKMIFPMVKQADDVLDCLLGIETFINEKLCK